MADPRPANRPAPGAGQPSPSALPRPPDQPGHQGRLRAVSLTGCPMRPRIGQHALNKRKHLGADLASEQAPTRGSLSDPERLQGRLAEGRRWDSRTRPGGSASSVLARPSPRNCGTCAPRSALRATPTTCSRRSPPPRRPSSSPLRAIPAASTSSPIRRRRRSSPSGWPSNRRIPS